MGRKTAVEVELDEELVRSLAPLDAWVRAFLAQSAQLLNGNNWLDRATHLRRLFLLSHCGARGSALQIAHLMAPPGVVRDVCGRMVPVRHGWRQGLTPSEAFARVVGARQALYSANSQFSALGEKPDARSRPAGHGVLSRARRARRPGVVFARAALQGEVDPLSDEYARLFVGLPEAGS